MEKIVLTVVFACLIVSIQGAPPAVKPDGERIIGGTIVDQRGKYPFIVSLQTLRENNDGTPYPAGHFCGASIIDKRWVLTAAHCLLGPMMVVAGKNNLTVDDEHTQAIKVTEVYPYPFYNSVNSISDIALLHLEKDLEFNQYVQPIALPQSTDPVPITGKSIMIGWGLNNDTGYYGYSNDLRQVDGELRPRTECISHKYYIEQSQVCTGIYAKTACKGDSGSPLVQIVDGIPRQIGVASYVSVSNGWMCAGDVIYTYPGAYVDNFIYPMMQYYDQIEYSRKTTPRGHSSAPFVVSVHHFSDTFTYKASKLCSGTIVDKSWILTAASCISNIKRIPGDGFYVISGANNPLRLEDSFSKKITIVDSFYLHPDYTRESLIHDVALLKLSEPLIIKSVIRTANIPSSVDYQPIGKVFAAGYALKGETFGHELMQNDATSFETELENIAECQKYHNPGSIDQSNTLCVKPAQVDLCQIDIGGPLYDETETIIGVSSIRNIPCGIVPEIYGKVTDSLNFIQSTMNRN